MIEKRAPYRNQRILDFARNCACFRCGLDDGTTVLAHYQGPRAESLGKGKAQKPDDDCGAPLCQKCHRMMDSYKNDDDRWIRSEEFLFYVVRFQNLLHRIGFKF